MDPGTTNFSLHHLSFYFNMSNIDLHDLNITTDHLKDFIDYIMGMQKNSTKRANEKPIFPVDLLKQFDSSGLNRTGRLEDDSITVNNINWISSIYSPATSLSQAADCDCYCGGLWRESLLEYKTIHGYIALVICLLGTVLNIFNVIVLTRREMSKAPINVILKWLAVTDIFVMLEYIPFSIYMYLIFPDRRDFKYGWAVYLLFHMHFTQVLHTISISLTVTLAIWRYIAIKHPHGRMASMILSHCKEAILLSFIIAPILCAPTYFVFRINENIIEENHEKVSLYHLDAKEDTMLYRFNFWVHSVLIKLLPCFILTLISFVLIRVLYKASKRKIKLKGGNYQPTVTPRQNQDTNANGTGALINGEAKSATTAATTTASGAQTLINQGAVAKKAPRTDRRTDRTTMLLVAVLLLFLITEFPQGILGLLSGILQKCFLIRCYSLFGELMDLLALINAAVGFILYGLMSKQFRTSFKALFIRRRTPTIEMTTTKVTGLTTTCV